MSGMCLECNSLWKKARLNFKTVGLKKTSIISVLITRSLFGNAVVVLTTLRGHYLVMLWLF